MRHRTPLLFILACVLIAVPVGRNYRVEAQCAEQYGLPGHGSLSLFSDEDGTNTSACPVPVPQPLWATAFGLAGVAVLLGFLLSFRVDWLARRREAQLLNAAGVRTLESDLPLDN